MLRSSKFVVKTVKAIQFKGLESCGVKLDIGLIIHFDFIIDSVNGANPRIP